MLHANNIHAVVVQTVLGYAAIEAHKMALGGVARPMKEVVWRSSILNFAKRKAEKAAMSRAMSAHQPIIGLR